MGIQLSQGGATNEPEVIADINTTPLIDVMLVLLIMLIITIPIQLHAVNMNMPQGNPPPPVIKPEVITISVMDSGQILWNGAVLTNPQFESQLQTASQQSTAPELHIRPSKNVEYQRVAYVMAAIQRLGLTKVGLIGGEQFL